MHSIRSKITALTIIAIITTVLCVLAVSFFTLKEKNDRESVEMMNLIAQDTKKSIGRYTESIEQSVEMAANIAMIQNETSSTKSRSDELQSAVEFFKI